MSNCYHLPEEKFIFPIAAYKNIYLMFLPTSNYAFKKNICTYLIVTRYLFLVWFVFFLITGEFGCFFFMFLRDISSLQIYVYCPYFYREVSSFKEMIPRSYHDIFTNALLLAQFPINNSRGIVHPPAILRVKKTTEKNSGWGKDCP